MRMSIPSILSTYIKACSCTLQRCYRGVYALNKFISVQVLPHPHEVALYSTISWYRFREMRYNPFACQWGNWTRSLLTVDPQRCNSREENHVYLPPCWICPLKLSMGRGYVRVAPSIHHSTTSQTVDNIWAVSGYVLVTYRRTYCLFSILVDVQHILSSNNPV